MSEYQQNSNSIIVLNYSYFLLCNLKMFCFSCAVILMSAFLVYVVLEILLSLIVEYAMHNNVLSYFK